MTTPSNKHNDGTPSLSVTPVSCCSAVKRKFPGPAGLLPKLVRKFFITVCIKYFKFSAKSNHILYIHTYCIEIHT